MTNGDTAQLIYLLGFLVLIGSSLLARRLPLGQSLKMALAWVAIFAVGFLLFSLRDDAGALWSRLTSEFNPSAGVVRGGTLRVRKSEDGHFWLKTEVNGRSVKFLIDSGATTISMSSADAATAGVKPGGGFPVAISTANGVVMAERARIERLKAGPIERSDLAAVVAPEFGETSVLGMNFLSSLKSWRVEGQELVLEP